MLPSSPDARFATEWDNAACVEAIRHGSRSFYAASLILPPRVRRPAFGLYAFCRLSDDAVDVEGGARGAVDRLRERLARAYDGRPMPIPADRALADILREFAIPRAAPEALLEGLAWDAEGRRYETLEALFDYAARVAGTVGVMMSLIMGVRSPEALARACDLGVAMQLTNIARDVGEDARAGRLYLPLRWLREAGVDPARFLAAPAACDGVKSVVARLLREADALYARARGGVASLPPSCRPAILAAAMLYAEIGVALEHELGLDSINHRARVSGRRKARLVARAVATTPFLSRASRAPPLDSVSFLIEAVMRSPAPMRVGSAAIGPQFLRVLDMFERLERAERFGK
jgi:phytoene synthase